MECYRRSSNSRSTYSSALDANGPVLGIRMRNVKAGIKPVLHRNLKLGGASLPELNLSVNPTNHRVSARILFGYVIQDVSTLKILSLLNRNHCESSFKKRSRINSGGLCQLQRCNDHPLDCSGIAQKITHIVRATVPLIRGTNDALDTRIKVKRNDCA